MNKLERVILKLKMLREIIQNAITRSMENHLPDFEELQKERLAFGVDAKGKELRRKKSKEHPYSNVYEKKRQSKGLQTSHVDLHVTGDFYEGIKAQKIGKKKVFIYSRDYKNDFLTAQYKDVFGFSPDQREQVKGLMIPEIEREIKQTLEAA